MLIWQFLPLVTLLGPFWLQPAKAGCKIFRSPDPGGTARLKLVQKRTRIPASEVLHRVRPRLLINQDRFFGIVEQHPDVLDVPLADRHGRNDDGIGRGSP